MSNVQNDKYIAIHNTIITIYIITINNNYYTKFLLFFCVYGVLKNVEYCAIMLVRQE